MGVIKCANCDKDITADFHETDHVDAVEFCSDDCFDTYAQGEEISDTTQIEEERLRKIRCSILAGRLWRRVGEQYE